MKEATEPKVAESASVTARWESRVKLAQDVVVLSKELSVLVVVFAVVYLLWAHLGVIRDLSAHFSGELRRAKLTGINIAGLGVSLGDSAQELDTAKTSIEDTKKALEELAKKTTDVAMKAKLEDLLKGLQTAATATNAAQEGIQSGISKQEQVVGPGAATGADGNWVVVVSADKDLDQAKFERDQLNKVDSNYRSTIYQRKSWYRTVVPFGSRTEANDALSRIRTSRSRPTAYVADLNAWCPQAQKNGSSDVLVCTGTASSD